MKLRSAHRPESRRTQRPGWRSAVGPLLAAALALTLALLPAADGQAHICQPDAELGLSGTLLLPSASGLLRLSLPDRTQRPVPILPANGVVSQVARAPDGGRLAVARFSRPERDPVGGSDLLIVGPEGGTPGLTIARERPGDLLGAPVWLPDGGLLLDHQTAAGPAAGSRVERVDADGGGRRLLIDRAASPTVSPDGQQVAFIRSEATDRLVLRPLEGGAERVLVDQSDFLALAYPRFSPDGGWLAFAAIGGPVPQPFPTPARSGISFVWPATRPARAHGLPWDLWLVRAAGGGLRRLTSWADDDAAPAWSPDGRWLAIYSGESIKAVAVDRQAAFCILGTGGIGGFEWLEAS
jgi:dipeptidyl aminopeptidase/acylaminoacyl peptidase